VANFASRVADNLELEGTTSFKPDADYMKNKKIAIQLAKRYIDDYKKMQKDPSYADEVRMDPEDFNPKKHPKLDKRARGEAVEFEEWAESVANEYVTKPRDEEDRREKLKTLNDIQKNPDLMKDPRVRAAVIKRRMELARNKDKVMASTNEGTMIGGIVSYDDQDPEEFKQAYLKYKDFMSEPRPANEVTSDLILQFMFDDEILDDIIQAEEDGVKDVRDMVQKRIDDLELFDKEVRPNLKKMGMQKIMNSEEPAQEGNQFAQAVQKAKAAGMKAGDKFKVGDQEYTLKDAIEMAGLQLEEFFSEEELAYENQVDRIKNLAFYQ